MIVNVYIHFKLQYYKKKKERRQNRQKVSIYFLKLETELIKNNPKGEKGKGEREGGRQEAGEEGRGRERERRQFYRRTSEKLRNCISGQKGIIRQGFKWKDLFTIF